MSRESLPALGDTIFDIVFGFFNSMISIFTGGAITDFLGGYSDLEGFWDDIEAWLITELLDAFTSVLGLTEDIWVENINKSYEGLVAVLDLSDWILQQYTGLVTVSEEQTEALILGINRGYTREIEIGEQMTDFAMRRIVQMQLNLDEFSTTFYDSLMEVEGGAAESLTTVSEESIAFVRDYLAADQNLIESLANADSKEAAAAILATAEEGARFINEWFLETVVKPISYGEVEAWAIAEGNKVDIDEALETVAELSVKWHELQLSMIKDRVVIPGGSPIPDDEE